MANRHRLVFGGVFLATLVAGSVLHWRPGTVDASTAAAPPRPPTVIVSKPLRREVTDRTEFAGRFEPSASVEIRPRVSGHLDRINFRDGEIVEAGKVLFVIDQRPYRTALAQAEAQLASAQAQAELANLELGRAEQLVTTAAVSRATADQRRQGKRQADASVQLAQAAVDRAKLDLDYTEIRAPFAGRLSNRRIDVGGLVAEDALLTTIVALDPLYFVFDISERDLQLHQRAVSSGDHPSVRESTIVVDIRLAGDEGWPLRGTIDFVDNRLEAGSGTIRARARLPNPDFAITPGQFGRARLPLSESYDALLVPETAVMTDQGDRVVLTVDGESKVKPAKVELGPRQGNGLRVVLNGLDADASVVINGLMRARAGQTVAVQAGNIEAPATAALN